MRPLKPNSRGIIVPTARPMMTHRDSRVYHKPCAALPKLDKLISGVTPTIAVTRTQGGIGDVLMTLPTVKAISKKYDCKIDYGTDFDYLEGALPKVLQDNPYINSIIPWREIDVEKYDAVIDLTCPCVAHEKPGAKPINRIDLFARHACVLLEDTSIDYQITDKELVWAKQYLENHNLDKNKLILVQPSSSSNRRDAPPQTVQRALASLLSQDRSIRVIIVTHTTDTRKSDWNFSDIHELRNYDIRQIAAIMFYCNLVLCPDSAILHMASALHKRTVTLFGPTDPYARVNYHPEAVAIWPGKDLRNYPCVGPDSLIKTSMGYKEIKDIKANEDWVKTSDSTYNKVTKFYKNKVEDRVVHQLTIFGSHHKPFVATEEHKFLVSYRKNKTKHFSKSQYIPNPEWTKVNDIEPKDYFCIPRNKPSNDIFHPKGFEVSRLSPEACWFYGLYLAEGYLKNTSNGAKQIVLSGSIDEQNVSDTLQKYLKKAFSIEHFQTERIKRKESPNCNDNHKTVNRIITNKKLFEFMEYLFGLNTTAHTKKIPDLFYHLPDKQMRYLLDGLFAGDGYEYIKENKISKTKMKILSTVSRELAYGTQELLTRFGEFGKVYKYNRDTNFKKNTHIYRVNVCLSDKHTRHIVDDNYIYVPVLKNKILDSINIPEYVYDITVENNPTFTLNNLATYDCWYEDPKDGYICWKRLEERDIVETCAAMLNNKPLPMSKDIVTFGEYAETNQLYEVL